MNELDPKKRRKLEKLAKIIGEGDLGIFEYVSELEDQFDAKAEEMKTEFEKKVAEIKAGVPNLEEILASIRGKDADEEAILARLMKIAKGEIAKLRPENGKTPTKEEITALIKPLIPQVKDGKPPTRSELLTLIEPLIPSLFELTKETVATLTPLIPKIEDIENDLPKLGAPIRDGLELLKGDERLDKSAVKGLEALEKEVTDLKARPVSTGGGGRSSNATKLYPLTADGVTKVFSVPKSVSSFLLCSDNLPSPLMENNGYTINGTRTQITITTDNAPTYGAQLLYVYQSVFNT